MKKLPFPDFDAEETYELCVGTVGVNDMRQRLTESQKAVASMTDAYLENFAAMQLHLLSAVGKPRETLVVAGTATNKDLKKLYTGYMVKKDEPRKIYDQILVQGQSAGCPYCGGLAVAKTLDHYLPKYNYPQFSVHPMNLVPCCRDCNTEKSDGVVVSPEMQLIHPYGDLDHFYSEQWIDATVVLGDKPTAIYFVNPPQNWPNTDQARAERHFESFDLGTRYSLQASAALPEILVWQEEYLSALSVADLSEKWSEMALRQPFVNHWKAVLYKALAQNPAVLVSN